MIEVAYNLNISPHVLKNVVEYQSGSIVSRELIKTTKTTITAFAFAKGQGLSEHTTPFTAFAQILDGEANISVDGKKYEVKEGQVLILPANTPHALQAAKQFKMLLTMAR